MSPTFRRSRAAGLLLGFVCIAGCASAGPVPVHLDGGCTVFGRVADGMEVADRVVQ